MTTARDIVNAALRRANVVGTGETPSADEAKETLERMNDFMASWSKKGWTPTLADGETEYSHATMTLNTTWTLDEAHVFGMKAILATMMCEEYGSPITPRLAEDARTGMNTLRSDFATRQTLTLPKVIRNLQRRC